MTGPPDGASGFGAGQGRYQPAARGNFLLERVIRAMVLGDQQVDGRHEEERENRPHGHPGDEHQADAVSRRGPSAGHQRQRKVAATVATLVIMMGRRRVMAASFTASIFVLPDS